MQRPGGCSPLMFRERISWCESETMSRASAVSSWTMFGTCIGLVILAADGLLIGSVALVVAWCVYFTGLSGLHMEFPVFR